MLRIVDRLLILFLDYNVNSNPNVMLRIICIMHIHYPISEALYGINIQGHNSYNVLFSEVLITFSVLN